MVFSFLSIHLVPLKDARQLAKRQMAKGKWPMQAGDGCRGRETQPVASLPRPLSAAIRSYSGIAAEGVLLSPACLEPLPQA